MTRSTSIALRSQNSGKKRFRNQTGTVPGLSPIQRKSLATHSLPSLGVNLNGYFGHAFAHTRRNRLRHSHALEGSVATLPG